jgi:hypothetical protein
MNEHCEWALAWTARNRENTGIFDRSPRAPRARSLDLYERSARFLGHAKDSVVVSGEGVSGREHGLSDIVEVQDFTALGTQHQSNMQLRERVESSMVDAIVGRLQLVRR